MENLRELLQESMNIDFIAAVLSNPRRKDGPSKVKVRPVMKKGALLFQFETFSGSQVFHKNLEAQPAADEIRSYMENMRQLTLTTRRFDCTALVSKKGKVTIKKKAHKGPVKMTDLSHNRQKRYILQEGKAVSFLVDLGVMTKEGKVIHARFDKFRQINRFLEFVEDILPELPEDREIRILDFGCGKSYLTFAVYYYLHELKGRDVRITGLDLKADVIRNCNELSRRCGYEKLTFLEGDVADYRGAEAVDMMITLHACDTATDYALARAVEWNAGVILSVPCCQHELNRQIKSETLAPVLEYGIIKERMAALVTDALRAQYLEREGYRTQLLEFIDMEHTPKNLLIRAVRTGRGKDNQAAIETCEAALGVSPMLGRLLEERAE